MFEKVNPGHPDKVADRIAGAIVDLAYGKSSEPRVAVEVLIGHGVCHIIVETDVALDKKAVADAVKRIAGGVLLDLVVVPQDEHLNDNQRGGLRCGDNGIFRGVPVTNEQLQLTSVAKRLWDRYHSDGKYILAGEKMTICQSNAERGEIAERYPEAVINPLGDWDGGTDVDTGATNRKLGSDMGDAVTGGGIHGKDLSKADVSVNIFAHLLAQQTGRPVAFTCSIGDEYVNGIPYATMVKKAKDYVESIGGFEALAEWGLIR